MNTTQNKSALIAEIKKLNIRVAELTSENEKLKATNQYYIEQLILAKRKIFCASSEHSPSAEQLGLFNEAEVDFSESKVETEKIVYIRRKRTGKREDFYEDLPTVQVVHELPEDQRICPDCGKPLHVCGSEVLRREVEVIPAQFRAVEHVQNLYSCRHCEKHSDADSLPLIKSNVPAPVIPNSGIASPSLVSFVACNKYVLALPIGRQEAELQRLGIFISRQTMSNWMIFISEHWLVHIYNLLHLEIIFYKYLNADETTLQVICEPNRKASSNSYMWVYLTGQYAQHQIVLFKYSETRAGHNPLNFLEGSNSYLNVDGYPGYNKLENQGIILVGCFVHARRKFDEALKTVPKFQWKDSLAYIGFDYCNQLFELEREYDKLNLTPEERFEQRLLKSKPVCDAFFAWAFDTLSQAAAKSKLRTALVYAINQKDKLCNFLLDGHLDIHNNRAENCIRPFTVGRKNWMFAYSPKGANASAVIYSIVQTALANGLVPFNYLTFLFKTLPNIPLEQYKDCLPWNPEIQAICRPPD